ncbi:MAG TPA: M4 family metallopeptidase [Thermoanaerobaculia bacterium]|nr:M4 family metallopeptidase [Thermoanaerobaculia bacterium]
MNGLRSPGSGLGRARRSSGIAVHCFIVPPEILTNVAVNPDATTAQRLRAIGDLLVSRDIRTQRRIVGALARETVVPTGTKRRAVYDAQNELSVHGVLRRGENDPPARDEVVNRAYDYSGLTYDFFAELFERTSIDDRGMRLDSTVHYGKDYANAFWNGTQMVYGDGDGELFGDFTQCIDIVAHEITHGVTQFEAGLEYQNQSGALNEHFSDVFGALVKQWAAGESAAAADWLIGKGIFIEKEGVKRLAVRSMAEPGTAYDDPLIGTDPQVGHMSDYVRTRDDDGGVHINSGIPNRAFVLAARSLGGNAWEVAGRIWYVVLRDRLRPTSRFQDCADQTCRLARELYDDAVAGKIADAWKEVGIEPRGKS